MESHGHAAAAAAAAGSSPPRLCAPISQPSSKSLTYATTLALLGFATPARNTNHENVVKIEKLSKSCNPGGSGLAFQPVLPASSSQDMIKAAGTVICPPTPPSRSPPHLHTPSSRETSGSDSASSSVDEVAKRRKLGGSRAASSAATAAVTTSTTTKVAGCASSTTLLSPTRAVQLRNQTCAGAASGSVPSSPREKAEFASPTTFVQADTSSFRELVQKLTGASDSDLEKKLPITVPSRQAARTSGGGAQLLESSSPAGSHKQQLDDNKNSNTFGGGLLISSKPAIDSLSARRPSFKLHERRQSNMRKLEIKPGLSTATVFKREAAANYAALSASSGAELVSPSNQKKFSSSSSPSSLATSSSPPPVLTPLSMQDVSEKTCYGPRTPTTTYESCYYTGLKPRSQNQLPEATERESHATPHFFLHPSPSSFDPTRPQPELLSLFPLSSPRATET
ncbi:hypothetical protein BDL97_02G102100 [Sphagnum fallax]|nr:hypothetical protein BDL97_02G102100 [Sphagnum fallax]